MKGLVLALLVFVAACGGDSTGPTKIEAEGAWQGTINDNGGNQIGTMSLTLTETSGNVSGTGNLSNAGTGIAVTASGTYSQPNLSLNLTTPGFSATNLTATVGQRTMTGTLNGSGFVNSAITLQRR
jgi:hypothetical protein